MKKWYEIFEERVNRAIYKKGDDMVQTRLADIEDDNEYEEAIKDLTWSAIYNDGGSDYGTLSIFEIYFLMVEADTTNTFYEANGVLAEYFYNLEYDERWRFSIDYEINGDWFDAVA